MHVTVYCGTRHRVDRLQEEKAMPDTSALTVPAAAKELGLSTSRIHFFIREGRLKATKVGGTWIIQRRDLAAVRNRPGPGWPVGRRAAHRTPADEPIEIERQPSQ